MSLLDELWEMTAPSWKRQLRESMPAQARQYVDHAIAPGTAMASAVKLQMTGEIKLKRWLPFKATQVIRIDRGFLWKARVQTAFGFINGSDQLIYGRGEMKWKLFGLLPMMFASGPDISRSAVGRLACESVWLPSIFCRPQVSFTVQSGQIQAKLNHSIAESPITIGVGSNGGVTDVSVLRWGNPAGGEYRLLPFGAIVEDEASFGGYTIPTKLRAGWGFGSEEFGEGEFFRCQVTGAEFR